MDNLRLILFVALSVVVLLLWQAWQTDHSPPAKTLQTSAVNGAAVPTPAPSSPGAAAPAPSATPIPTPAAALPNEQQGLVQGQRIRVQTDVLIVEIDTLGGDVRQADLPTYPESVDKPGKPYRLHNDSTPLIFDAQAGLLSASAAPDHHARYSADQTDYRLADGANEIKVQLHWTDEQGITVTKIYTFN